MAIFGYVRVSTQDQNMEIQIDRILKAYPGAVIRAEKRSGGSIQGREMLELVLDVLMPSDKLVVLKLDRLARNMNDLLHIVEKIQEKGSSLEILDQKIDTGTAAGRAFLMMLGVFAEFELNLLRERQRAGIAKAKKAGKYLGRPSSFDKEKIIELLRSDMSKAQIAQKMGCCVKTIYRVEKTIG